MTGDAGSIWKRTGWFVEPENLPDLMASLGAIGVYSSGQQFAWRGHSSSDFAIESSLIRHLKTRGDFRKLGGTTAPESEAIVRDKELKIIEQARGWGLGIRDSSHVDDLQLLADLQHYGLPTRLIDFTSNPMTALWFAAQTPPDGKVARSGVLIALNVTNLKRYPSIGDPYAVAFEQEEGRRSTTLETALALRLPFVVEASLPNARLRAQEGFFVAGAQTRIGLAHWLSPFKSFGVPHEPTDPLELSERLHGQRGSGRPPYMPFVAVIIKSRLKKRLLRILEGTYNRTSRVLFPDYDGFNRHYYTHR